MNKDLVLVPARIEDEIEYLAETRRLFRVTIPAGMFQTTDEAGYRWKNITPEIQECIRRTGIREGQAVVQTNHTTSTLLLNEDEEGLLESDIPKLFSALDFLNGHYRHDRPERLQAMPAEPKNGASHCQCIVAGSPSLALIVSASRVLLGEWQAVLFYDCNPANRPTRSFRVNILGE